MILPPAPAPPAYQYTLTFAVRPDDDLHRIVRDTLLACGYADVSGFDADIRAENPAIVDWEAVAEGSTIQLPSKIAVPGRS